MAAVFSGNGLGLFDSSWGRWGIAAGDTAQLGQGRDSQYVNVATGGLLLQGQDEQLVFRGLSVAQLRTYNSQGTVAQAGADGWVTGFERRVSLLSGAFDCAGSVMRVDTGDGGTQDFTWAGPGRYVSSMGAGANDTLTWSAANSNWTLVEGSTQRAWVFADHADPIQQGRLVQIRDLRSDVTTPTAWDVLYDGSNRVWQVRAADGTGNGDELVFGYDAITGQLRSLSTREAGLVKTQVSYSYDTSGRLSEVLVDLTPDNNADNTWNTGTAAANDGHLFCTAYTYDGSSLRIASVTQSDGTVVSYSYDAAGRVRTVTRGDFNTNDADGAGQTLTYAYDTTTGTTDVTDAAGRTWSYVHDAQGRLTQVLAPAISGLRDVTAYVYDAVNRLVQAKSTRGAQVLAQTDYAYDASGNRTWEWTLVDPAKGASAIQRTYDASNQLLSETHYTGLDADGAGTAQAPSGGQATHFVYDAQSRLRFTIDSAGSVTEYRYATGGNAIGQQVSARRYLGAAYAGSTFNEADLAAWAPAQLGSSALTETTYDIAGRISQVTQYASVASDGSGILDDAAQVVLYAYDPHGQLLSTVTRRSSTTTPNDGRDTSETTTYTYDGRGRLLSEVGPTGVVTTWSYLDSAATLRTTFATGLQRTQVRDAAGELVSMTESAVADPTNTRTTRNYYDASGQLRASEDASGARTYYFYDAKGALVGQVDETGVLVESVRDGVGRVVATKAYSIRLDTSGWLVNGAVVPTSYTAPTDPAVRVTTFAYDDAGELLTQTDPAGTITAYTYDATGRLLQAQVSDPLDASTARVTRQLYDGTTGRLVGTLDAEGYLTEYQYDVAGRQVATIRYATATPSAQRASGTLAQLRPTTSAQDQVTRSFYDGRNQLIGQLDAEGYLTEYVYDESQHQRAERRYAKQLTGLSGSEAFTTLRTSAQTGAVHETRRTFDALGQLITELNFEGTVTRYTYDAAGRLTGTVAADATSDVREGHRRYDVFGNLIGELGGEGSTHLAANMTETQLDALYAQYGTRHSYDALGHRIESIDAQGNKTWYFYDAAGRQTFLVRGVAENNAGQTGALNSYAEVTETRYDAFGEITDSIAYTGRIALATPGDRASVGSALTTLAYVSAVDSKRSQTWTTRGLLASVTDAEGALTQYTYNAFGELSRTDRAVGNAAATSTTYAYDRRGLQTGRTEAVGAPEQRSTSQVYDAFGRVITATDARGSATRFGYDRLGRLLTQSRVVQGRTETTTTAYDAYSRTVSVIDAETATTTYFYDDAARSMTVTTPEGVTVTTVHTRLGQTWTVTDNLQHTTTYTYDDDGHLKTTQDALGNVATNTYDTRGLLSRTTDASGRVVELHYDAVGRVLSRVVDPVDPSNPNDPAKLKLTTTYCYDGQGRQLQVIDPSGRITQYSYDREGRLTLVSRDPSGLNLRTRYTYDALGNQVTVVSGDGTAAARTVQYAYDDLGRRVSETRDPGTGHLNLTTTYAYDANDNVIRRTDAAGAVTRYYYEEANRLTCSVDPLGGVTRNWYDADGRLVATRAYAQASELVLADNTTLASIDASLVARTEDQGTYRVYDHDGRLRFTLDLAGTVVETTYDAANRVTGTRQYVTTCTPDATLQAKLLAGTALPADIVVAHNDAQDLQSYAVYDAAGHQRYTVDALGNVEERYYDAAGRQVGTRRYATALTSTNFSAIKAALQAGTAVPNDIATRVVADDAHDTRTYEVFDAAGRVVFTVDALGAVQRAFYDAAGHQVGQVTYATAITVDATLLGKLKAGASVADITAKLTSAILTDARNTEHYQVYDAAGRQTDTIEIVRDAAGNATGLVQQTTWDEADGVTVRNELQTTLTSAIVSAHAAEMQAGTATHANIMTWLGTTGGTRYTRSLLDAAGRVHYLLTRNSGNTLQVTERKYDAMGRVIQETVYANAIPDTAITDTAVQSALGGSPSRITRYAYDAAGHLRFQVDALGGVSERLYDAIGRLVEERSYDIRISVTGTLTESAVLAALEAARQTRWSTELASLPVTGLNTSLVGAYGSSLVYANGQLVFTPADPDNTVANSVAYPWVCRTDANATSDNVVFRAEMTTASALTSYFLCGLENLATGANYRRAALYVTNGVLYSHSVDATGTVNRAVGTLSPNKTYVVEAHSRAGGVDYFVYVKGTDKTAGFRFTITEADQWDSVRLRMWSQARDGASSNPTYIDNLSESVAPSRHTSYRYDAAGRLVETTDALGNSESYGYDARGLLTTRTDKLGNVWTYAYDAAGRKTSETSPAVSVASVSYDTTAKTWSSTTATRAVVTAYTYDALGNLLTRTEDSGQASARTTTYQYDNRGHQVRTVFPRAWQIDPATGQLVDTLVASEITVTYDALGRAVVEKDVRGNTSYKVYDNEGRIAYDIDQEGYVTRYGYNAFGEQATLTRYANRFDFTKLTGWTTGSPISLAQMTTANALVADGAHDRTITTAYDLLGNKTSVTQSAITYYKNDGTSATGSPTTIFAYNTYGELVQQSVLVEGTTWATTTHYYDDLGREILTVDPEGYVTRTAYNAEGDVTEVTEYARAVDASVLSPSTLPAVPAAGDAQVGYDRVTRYTYDALGRKASQVALRHYERSDGSSAATSVESDFAYDSLDHLLTTTVDGVMVLKSTYDALGRTASSQEAARDVLRGDAESQLAATTTLDLGSAALYEQASPYTEVSYDAFGNAVKTVRYANGMRNGVATADATRDQVSLSVYDHQGRAVVQQDVYGNKAYTAYDAADHVLHAWCTLSGSASSRDTRVDTVFQYDKVGRQTATTITRQLTSGGTVSTERADVAVYNAFGDVVQKSATGLSGTLDYTYDQAGNLTSSNEAGGTRWFGCNLAGVRTWEQRCVSELNGSALKDYTETWRQLVDRLGRVIESILPSNTSDRAVVNAVVNTVDRWGNVIEQIDPRGYRTRTEYNESNQATRQIAPQVEVVGEDGMVRWVSPETRWFYDASGRLVSTRDANGHVKQNVYNDVGQLVSTVDGLGATTTKAYDALGNARLEENVLGYVTWQAFDRLGRVTSQGDLLPNSAGTARSSATRETYTLDQNSNRIRVSNGLSQTAQYDYDSQGNLLRSQTAAGIVTSYGYDVLGHKVLELNALSQQLTWSYDVYGRVTDHDDLIGVDFNYVYDAQSGQLVSQSSSANTSATTIPGGLETGASDPMDRADQRTTYYYPNGLVRRIEEPGGVWYSYEYDANDNRTLEISHAYDGRGLLVYTRTRTAYDSHNRVAHVYSEELNTDGSAAAVQLDLRYGYDAVGNRRVVVADSGWGVDSSHDPDAPNAAPVLIGTPKNQVVKAGIDTQISLRPMDVFQDPEQKAMTFSATLSNNTALPAWLTLDATQLAATGGLVFTAHSSTAAGQSAIVRLKATDVDGNVRYVDFTVSVVADTAPVASTNTAPVVMITGQPATVELAVSTYFSDADAGDILSISLDSISPAASWLTVDTSTPGVLRLSGTPTSVTTYTLTLRATDLSGLTVTRTLQLKTQTNVAPVATSAPAQTAVINRAFLFERSLSQLFTDSNGDRMGITATLSNGAPLPDWLNLQVLTDTNPPTVRLIGYVPPDTDPQSLSVVLKATDPYGASATLTVAINLIDNPGPTVLATPPTQNGRVYAPYSATFNIADYFRDDQGDPFGLSLVTTSQSNWIFLDVDAAAGTFTLLGKPGDNSKSGQYDVQVKATDIDGASSVITIHFNIKSQYPPSFGTATAVNLITGAPFTITSMTATDPEGDPLTYSANSGTRMIEGMPEEQPLPDWLFFNPYTGVFSGTAPPDAYTDTIFVTATDGVSTVTKSFTLSVNVNQGVQLTGSIPAGIVALGNSWTYTVPSGVFTDPEGQALTWSATQLPAGLSFDPATHRFTGTPTTAGTYTIVVRATDPGGMYAETSFSLKVNAPPTVAVAIPDQSAPATGGPWSYTFPGNTFSDANLPSETLTYSATGLPSWMTFNPTSRSFTGTPGPIGSWTITVTATDGSGAAVSDSFVVTTGNAAPVVASPITDKSIVVNQSWSWAFPTTTFRDYNDAAQVFTYTASGMPGGVTFNASTRTFSGTPTVPGNYTVNVTASDGSLSVTDSFVLAVTNNPPTVQTPIPDASTPKGQPWSYTFPTNTFVDVNGQALTYGATGLPPGVTFNAATRTFSGTPTTYGTYSITVTASDGYASVSDVFAVSVINVPPAYNGGLVNRTANQGSAVSWALPSNMFTDPNGDSISYSLLVERPGYWTTDTTTNPYEPRDIWHDEVWMAGSNVGLSINATTGQITGTATSWTMPSGAWGMNPAQYAIKVIASDQVGSAEGEFVLDVNRLPGAPTIPNQTIKTSVAWSYTVPAFSDADGDALTYSATGLPAGLAFNASTRVISGTPTTAGTYTVTITANDGNGGVTSKSFTITVQANTAPTAPTIANQPASVGVAWTFTVPAFSDPNGDPLTYSATGLPPGLGFNTSTRVISGTPTTAGTYTTTVTANDGRGGITTASFTITVAAQQTNHAPVLASPIPDIYVMTGDTLNFSIRGYFSDPDNNLLTYTAVRTDGQAFPAWLHFDGTQGVFTGSVSGIATADYSIQVTAKDPAGLAVSDIFVIHKEGDSGSTKLMADSSPTASPQGGGSGSGTDRSAAQPTNAAGDANAHGGGAQSQSSGSMTLTADATVASGPTLLTADGVVNPVTTATPFSTGGAARVAWYTYDANDRTLVHEGTLQNGQIVIGAGTAGYEQRYDAAGQATLRFTSQYSTQAERTYYDLRGEITGTTAADIHASDTQIVEQRKYDAAGRLSQIVRYYHEGTIYHTDATTAVDVSGFLQSAENYYYNQDGQVTSITQLGRSQETTNGVLNWLIALQPTSNDAPVRSKQSTDLSVLRTASTTTYTGTGLGYDAVGNLRGYKFEVMQDGAIPGYSQTYTYTYEAREQYLEKTVSGTSSDPNFKATTVTSYYDAAGRRIAVEEDTPKVANEHTMRYFSYDAEGHILTRRDGQIGTNGWYQPARGGATQPPGEPITYPDNPISERLSESAWEAMSATDRSIIIALSQDQRFVYVNDQQVSQGTKAGNLSVTSGLTAYGDAGAGRMQVVVQEGDTLRGVALRVYGNADLWYVLADANAMHADKDLVAGTEITVPSIKVNSNDASTFKPYNPGEIIGPTTPDMPYIAPPKPHCNALAMILIIVVVVLVTVFTAGALTAAIIPAAEAAAGATLTVLGGMVVGAVAGAAGALAGQVVGSAMGVSSFSWRNVAAGALTGAITGGIAAASGSSVSSAAEAGHYGEAAGLALSDAGANYAGQKLAGLKTSFSWKSIAASAVSSVVTAKVAPAIDGKLNLTSKFSKNLTAGVIGGMVSAQTRHAMGGGERTDYLSVALDAFGNALGSAIAGGIQTAQANRAARMKANQQAYDAVWADGNPFNDGQIPASTDGDPSDPFARPIGTAAQWSAPMSAEERAAAVSRLEKMKQQLAKRGIGTPGAAADPGSAKYGYNVPTVDQILDPKAYNQTRDYLLDHTVSYLQDLAARGYQVPQEFPGIDISSEDLVSYNEDLKHWLYDRVPLSTTQKVLAAGSGAVVGALNWGGNMVTSGVTLARDVVSSGLVETGLADNFGVERSALNYHDEFGHVGARTLDWMHAPVRNTIYSFGDRYAAAKSAWARGDINGIYNGAQMYTSTTLDAGSLAMGVGGVVRSTAGVLARGLSTIGRAAEIAAPLGSRYSQWGAVGDLSRSNAVGEVGVVGNGEVKLSATQLRSTPGIATVSGDLTPASGSWLDAGVPTPIPAQVGNALAGRSFNTFGDLRQAIWEQIGSNPELNGGFSRANLAKMNDGLAPSAPTDWLNETGAFGDSFNIHHADPIEFGGAVYDLSNLRIVSPKVHFDIHYGPN